MREVIIACLLAFLLALSPGCGASFFSANTTATYTISPDGKSITYSSNKEQQGLALDLQEKDGRVTIVKIRVDKATTQEEVIRAALEAQLGLQEMLAKLLPLIEKAALAGS